MLPEPNHPESLVDQAIPMEGGGEEVERGRRREGEKEERKRRKGEGRNRWGKERKGKEEAGMKKCERREGYH